MIDERTGARFTALSQYFQVQVGRLQDAEMSEAAAEALLAAQHAAKAGALISRVTEQAMSVQQAEAVRTKEAASVARAQRVKALWDMRQGGASVRACAEAFGISRTRASQLLSNYKARLSRGTLRTPVELPDKTEADDDRTDGS